MSDNKHKGANKKHRQISQTRCLNCNKVVSEPKWPWVKWLLQDSPGRVTISSRTLVSFATVTTPWHSSRVRRMPCTWAWPFSRWAECELRVSRFSWSSKKTSHGSNCKALGREQPHWLRGRPISQRRPSSVAWHSAWHWRFGGGPSIRMVVGASLPPSVHSPFVKRSHSGDPRTRQGWHETQRTQCSAKT